MYRQVRTLSSLELLAVDQCIASGFYHVYPIRRKLLLYLLDLRENVLTCHR